MLKTNGPWKIKSSVEKYKNPWLKVREDQVVRPDGKDGIFGVVEMISGVSVLPMDNEGFVYVTEEFRYAIEQNSVEVVSGGVDINESPLDAGKRELKEELGIEADEWIHLGKMNPFSNAIKSPAELFLVKKLNFTKSLPEGTEQIKVIKIKLGEAVRMVMKSKITHGQSCVLILKAAQYLGIK